MGHIGQDIFGVLGRQEAEARGAVPGSESSVPSRRSGGHLGRQLMGHREQRAAPNGVGVAPSFRLAPGAPPLPIFHAGHLSVSPVSLLPVWILPQPPPPPTSLCFWPCLPISLDLILSSCPWSRSPPPLPLDLRCLAVPPTWAFLFPFLFFFLFLYPPSSAPPTPHRYICCSQSSHPHPALSGRKQ